MKRLQSLFVLGVIGTAALAIQPACSGSDKKKDDPNAVADAGPASPAQKLAALAEEYWQFGIREYPETATELGMHEGDDKLTDITPEGFDRRAAQLNAFLARALEMDPSTLGPGEKSTLDILLVELRDGIKAHELGIRRWALLDQLSGPQAGGFATQVVKYHPRRNAEDIKKLIARYKAFKPWMEAYVALLRSGMEKSETAPSVTVSRVVEQVKAITTQKPEESKFVTQVTLPDGLTDDEKKALKEELTAAVKDSVLPAFASLQSFLEIDYILNARADVGIKSIPNGEAVYAYYIQHYLTRPMTPDELHELGTKELAGVEAEMMKIALTLKHKKRKPLSDFSAKLLKDKKNHTKDKDVLLALYRGALERAKAKVPEVLDRLPGVDVEVTEMDPIRALSAPVAYYEGADLAGSRPARFVANTHDVETRPLCDAEALTFHESIPGHHVQIGLAHELQGLPAFRKTVEYGAFVEGWALYGERLSDELGLYSTPQQRYCYLAARAWRAARLVVDTGLHAKGWDRDKAVAFMKEHTMRGAPEIENEVDRYITWPGQALGYLVGALEIEGLREKAKADTGDKFDLKAFHAAVLSQGAVPLDTLKAQVEAWVASVNKPAEAAASPDGGAPPAGAADGGTGPAAAADGGKDGGASK